MLGESMAELEDAEGSTFGVFQVTSAPLPDQLDPQGDQLHHRRGADEEQRAFSAGGFADAAPLSGKALARLVPGTRLLSHASATALT